MAVIQTPHGGMTVRDPPRSSSGGGGGMTTRKSPTPSAERLYGSAKEKEAQIRAFRSGGYSSMNRLIEQLKQQELAKAEAERLKKIEEAKAKAEKERKRLQELKEKRLRSSREREAIQRKLSQDRDRLRFSEVTPAKKGIVDRSKMLLQTTREKLQTLIPATQEWSGSLTQEYHELFGTKFYKKGEREQLIQQGLKNLTGAQNYEEQQQAIKNLEKKGIKITDLNGTYQIEGTEKLAPTSRVGNLLIGATDIFFKSAVFSPLISTATASKQEQTIRKLTEREKLDIYSKSIQQARVQPNALSKLREGYRQALKSGDQEKIKSAETIIKDFYAQTKEGQRVADSFIKDVKVQEGILKEAPSLIIEKGIIDLPKSLPSGEATGTAGLFRVDQTKGVNKFEVLKPEGKIKSLGITGTRLDLSTTQKEAQTQKNVLGLKTSQQVKQDLLTKQIQKPAQKQPQKEALALSSALKTKQTLRQQQVQKLSQMFREQGRYGQPQKPKLRGFIPPVSFGLSKALTRVKEIVKDEKEFELFGRRFGEFKSLGIFTTQKQVEKKGREFLTQTLGRTIKIIKDDKPLKFSETGFGFQFRPAKKDTTKIVQKAKFSLGTSGEVSEIMGFKKRASKKSKKKTKRKSNRLFNWFSE